MNVTPICVIELDEFKVLSVTVFPDTIAGGEAAETLFKQLYKDHNDPDGTTGVEPLSDEELDDLNGAYKNDEDGYQIVLMKSSKIP